MKKIYLFLCFAIFGLESNAQVIQSDSLALVAFYNALDGPNWTNNDNWLNGPVGSWYGITVANQRVTFMDLHGNSMSGDLPDEFYQLTDLRRFNFLNNNITGELKPEIGNMTKLSGLGFQGCKLSGSIPEEIVNIPNLSSLSFASNNLSGPLPDFLDQIPLLNTVFFQSNRFTGEIPETWRDCKNLATILIGGNQLTGTLDPFGSMPKLRNFRTNGNNWDPQAFPAWIDSLEDLFNFVCNDCNLVGDIPEMDLTDQADFNSITLSNNRLTGGVEYLFGPQIGRKFNLNISNNNFTGSFPSSKIKYMTRIDIRQNAFDAFDSFDFEDLDQIIMFENKFTFESLLPHKAIFSNDTITINASNQDSLLTSQTIDKESGSSITLRAGDNAEYNNYTWLKDGGNISGANEATLSLNNLSQDDAGVYICRITNDSIPGLFLFRHPVTLTIDGVTSTKQLAPADDITLYPNPVSEYLYIRGIETEKPMQIKVYNATGQLVRQQSAMEGDPIPVFDLPMGWYLLEGLTNSDNFRKAFVKQ